MSADVFTVLSTATERAFSRVSAAGTQKTRGKTV